MDTKYTIVDTENDTIEFATFDHEDIVFISIPFNPDTMESDTAIVEIDKQDLARLFAKLDLPEVTYE